MKNYKSDLYKVLNGVNVNAYTEEKQGLTYLKWNEAFRLLNNYVDATEFNVIETPDGLQYWDSPLGIIVKTEVKVSYMGEEYVNTMSLPVLDFKNNPMYSTPGKVIRFNKEQERPVASSFDINTTIMRCYVKTIALFGLGSYIYSGLNKPETTNETNAKPISAERVIWNDFVKKCKEENQIVDSLLSMNNIDKSNKEQLLAFCKTYLKGE